MDSKPRIHIVANSARSGDTLGGNDRIFIELARRWAQMGCEIIIYTTREQYKMFQRQKLDQASYVFLPRSSFRSNLIGIAYFYLEGTFEGLKYVWSEMNLPSDDRVNVVCSNVEAWCSTIPAWAMSRKLKSPWIASFFLFSPKPWARDPVFLRRRALFFYLSEQVVYWLVKLCANMVFVTNEIERCRFQSRRLPLERIIAVKGGVDIKMTDSVPAPPYKEFDAVFLGRMHWQKGVLELVDIWQCVCRSKPEARLAMIGNGELDQAVAEKVTKLGLQNNVTLFGFMDGPEKIKIFKSSRVVVHPARHDNGGQAAAEAMACGLPGVSFDLPALRVYYPRGMLKAPMYDQENFAQLILDLLGDDVLYARMSQEAREYALEWDWDQKAEHVLKVMLSTLPI